MDRARYERPVHAARKEAHHLKRVGGVRLGLRLERLHIELLRGRRPGV
jgi:hypothetical protein